MVVSDSLAKAPDSTKKAAALDSTILYSADKVAFTFNPRITILTGNADVQYKSMHLTAGRIEIRWDEDLLIAQGLPDSLKIKLPTDTNNVKSGGDSTKFSTLSDSTKYSPASDSAVAAALDSAMAATDSLRIKDKPKMADGIQVITGETMTYNIRNKRGRVIEGVTNYEQGKYHGGKIKKVDEETYDISNGFYTTCDAPDPHYGFYCSEMKLIMHDKVIARPVVLEFGPVPVAILPFGIFPAHGGRHSGILVPTYGESSGQGRFFTGLGYYWAPNDYLDARASLDYYERSGILLHADGYYAKRYIYHGSLSGSYINQSLDGVVTRRWDLKVDHSHDISPNSNLLVNAYFVSDNSYLRDISQNPDQRLKKTIQSDATYNQRWPSTLNSGTINLHRFEDLSTGHIELSLPQASFSRGQSPIIPPPEGTKPDSASWYNMIYYRYGATGLNTSVTNVAHLPDRSIKESRDRSGLRHDVGITASLKPFGVVAFSPTFNYNEVWLDEWLDFTQRSNAIVDTLKQKTFRARRTFSTGAGLSTKLYGLFKPGVFGVTALRHTLSPSLTFSYTPDFAESQWGYYKVYRDTTTGLKSYYDEFGGNLFGSTPRDKQMSLGIGVDNLFEYKRTVDGKESKGELFGLGFSTGYTFTADSLKWQDLSSRMRIKPLMGESGSSVSGLGLDISARHSFYAVKEVLPGTFVLVNRSAPNGLRLLSFDLTTSLKFTGGAGGAASSGSQTAPRDTTAGLTAVATPDRFSAQAWTPSPLPWSAGMSLRYGENRITPTEISKDAWASLTFEVKATTNWKINSDIRVNLLNKKIDVMSITLYRDLHCWEGRLTWNPVGLYKGYYLIINVKSSNLKDVKVEKRRGGGGFLGF